jgi:hypothetical protein
LKKRTKKLLPLGTRGPFRIGPHNPGSKSFLLLFFKKEVFLPSLKRLHHHHDHRNHHQYGRHLIRNPEKFLRLPIAVVQEIAAPFA